MLASIKPFSTESASERASDPETEASSDEHTVLSLYYQGAHTTTLTRRASELGGCQSVPLELRSVDDLTPGLEPPGHKRKRNGPRLEGQNGETKKI